MSEKRTIRLVPASRKAAIEAVRNAPDGYLMTIQPPKRSLEQNAKLWAMLADVSRQVEHRDMNLKPIKLKSEEWKDLFTAHLKRQVMLPNIEGDGWIALGTRTSEMSVGELGDLIECILCYGANKGVKWSEPEA